MNTQDFLKDTMVALARLVIEWSEILETVEAQHSTHGPRKFFMRPSTCMKHKIDAIKLLRDCAGLSLVEGKRLIEDGGEIALMPEQVQKLTSWGYILTPIP